MGQGLWPGFPTVTCFNVKLFMFSMSLGVLYQDGVQRLASLEPQITFFAHVLPGPQAQPAPLWADPG